MFGDLVTGAAIVDPDEVVRLAPSVGQSRAVEQHNRNAGGFERGNDP